MRNNGDGTSCGNWFLNVFYSVRLFVRAVSVSLTASLESRNKIVQSFYFSVEPKSGA